MLTPPTGEQIRRLHSALRAACLTCNDFERLVRFGLDTSLAAVAGDGLLTEVAFR